MSKRDFTAKPRRQLTPCPTRTRFTRSQLSTAPSNAAAWAYLRGILSHVSQPLTSYDLEPFVRNLGDNVAPALEYRLDVVEEGLLSGKASKEAVDDLVKKLVEVDPIRRRWWEARRGEIGALQTAGSRAAQA